MKKIITLIIAVFLLSAIVYAEGAQNGNPDQVTGTGNNNSNATNTENGTGQGQNASNGTNNVVQTQNQNMEVVMAQQQTQANDVSELHLMIQQKQQEMNQELTNFQAKTIEVYQNQNKVRLAVHSLLSMEDLTGNIGAQISEIARNFNNSVQATINAEEKIQNRNAFVRFFMGGNSKSAEDIAQEVAQNRLRIQELTQLKEQCSCSEEVKAVIQEQIQNMKQEQTRLQELAQQEKQKKGLFKWF